MGVVDPPEGIGDEGKDGVCSSGNSIGTSSIGGSPALALSSFIFVAVSIIYGRLIVSRIPRPDGERGFGMSKTVPSNGLKLPKLLGEK